MDNDSRHFRTLLAAACLTFGGVAVLAVGVGMAGGPLRRAMCLSVAPGPCCIGSARQTAEMPTLVGVPTLHTITIVAD